MLHGEWVFPRHIPMWDPMVVGEHSQWNFFYGLRKYNPSKNKKNKKTPLRIPFRKWTQNQWKLLSIHSTWINRRNPSHQIIPIPDSKNNRNTLQNKEYHKSYELYHYYTNNKSKTIRKNSKMETIWKTKHKNIPSPNPKLLERSYKISRPPDLTSCSLKK